MKELFLLRHAKSDWNTAVDGDHARPLNARGVRAARAVGRFLRAAERLPDRILTSSAIRACTTVELAAEAGEWDIPITTTDALYATRPEAVVDLLREQRDDPERLLIAGHEPTWSALVGLLTGARVRFPTATLAIINLPIVRWRDLQASRGELAVLLPPKLIS